MVSIETPIINSLNGSPIMQTNYFLLNIEENLTICLKIKMAKLKANCIYIAILNYIMISKMQLNNTMKLQKTAPQLVKL